MELQNTVKDFQPTQTSDSTKKKKLEGESHGPSSNKRLKQKTDEDTNIQAIQEDEKENNENILNELPGIPLVPSYKKIKPRITFILEKASLVPAYVGKNYQILNPEEHADFMRKKKMNPYDHRPDIVHEALREIMTSRLCMAGAIEAVYVKTDKGVLIKVDPHIRIPESSAKFCSMMSQLLQKFRIKARGKRDSLLRVIKNPVIQHLPMNCRKIGLSVSSNKAVELRDYVSTSSNDVNLVFVVGAMAHGKIDADYVEDLISVSKYPLSAAVCLRRICYAIERNSNIW